jgi:LuxR family maltose regulon positive regulatory protein
MVHMSKIAKRVLTWSNERHAYEWSSPRSSYAHSSLPVEKALRVDGSSFSFQGKHGHLTLRKETRLYGEGYWYAYRTQDHRTHKKYVGRSADLTISRLEKIAKTIEAELRLLINERLPRQEISLSDKAFSPDQEIGVEHPLSPEEPVPLLLPKFSFPRPQASLLLRKHLLARLDRYINYKLTLLSAPAGFGKTTLVSQWLLVRNQYTHASTVSWVALDAGDNDPIRFWYSLLTACQKVQAGAKQSALTLFQTPSPPLERVLLHFLNNLSALTHPFLLVLEDYHNITSPHIHEMMSFFLDHLPSQIHLIITSRVDPPLPLARLRARNELQELGATDLRFSQEETEIFLQQSIPAALSSDIIARLNTGLEGWVTGLRLITLALQGSTSQQEVEHFLTTFSGSHRHILEYFVTEVLDAQSEPIQHFLLRTSMLHRLTGSLCNAVTEQQESTAYLEAIERANLFLYPLDDNGQWYRYHALFAEAMQHEARRRLGDEVLRVSAQKACHWYEQHGLLSEAIETALEAQAFTQAANLIERNIKPHYAYQKRKEYYTPRRWMDILPTPILSQHPDLCSHFALLLLFRWDGQPDLQPSTLAQIETFLQLAERFWQAEENQGKQAELLAFRSLLARLQGDLPLSASFARQALAGLPEDQYQWRGATLSSIGTEEFRAGRLHSAKLTLQEAHRLFNTAGNQHGARAVLLLLGKVAFLQGELQLAAELYHQILTLVGEDNHDRAEALLGLARLSYEWNDLHTAEQRVHEVFKLNEQLANEEIHVHATLMQAYIVHAYGNTELAQQTLYTLLARAQTQQSASLQQEILALQARFRLAAGDFIAVERWWSSRAAYGEQAPSSLQEEAEELLLARLLTAQTKTEEAIHLLTQRLDEAHEQGRIRSEIQILILLTHIHTTSGHKPQANASLERALMLAHAEGYQRIFLDEGKELINPLRAVLRTLEKEAPRKYTHDLLFTLSLQYKQQTTPISPISALLTEPLSLQEQRVLHLLADGLSNREIAEALVVSINTVKTQVQSIYRKLNVKSRKEVRNMVPHPNHPH